MAENPSTPPVTKRAASKGRVLAWAAVVLVLGLVAVAAGFFLGRGANTTQPPKSSGSTAPTSSGGAQPDGPNGCVGGKDPSTAIATAFDEPISKRGAIQFTATTLRWLTTTETDAQQLSSVGPKLVAKAPLEHYTKVNEAGGEGEKLTYSTAHSRAWVSDFDPAGKATVVFFGEMVEESNTRIVTRELPQVVTLKKQGSHWFMSETGPGHYGRGDAAKERLLSDLESKGVALAGGC